MSYQGGYTEPVPPLVGPWTALWSPVAGENSLGTVPVSGTWQVTSVALYYPIAVPSTCIARRVWWANGSSVSATYNIDVGIYASTAAYAPGTRLASCGSTAQGTASTIQFADITDTTLNPGLYWVAISCSSTSATFFRTTMAIPAMPKMARFEESGAVPLPATATPAASTSTHVYVFGFATTASP